MKKYAVLSASGTDRVGLADDLTVAFAKRDIDMKESRMATLGGKFAILAMLSGENEKITALRNELSNIGEDLRIELQLDPMDPPKAPRTRNSYTIESSSLDSPGFVQAVTALLKDHDVNIEDLETDASTAPWTGGIQFRMRAHVDIPSTVSMTDLKRRLRRLERERDLEIALRPVSLSKELIGT